MKVQIFKRHSVMAAAALVLIVALPALCAAQPAPSGQTIMLKVASFLPVTHYESTQVIKPWMARVVQLSKTKVEFQHYPGEQLGKQADGYNLLQTGVADIATPQINVTFPFNTIWSIPGLYDTCTAGTKLYQAMLQEGPLREEFMQKGVRPLALYTTPPYEVFSAKKDILKMDDLKGMKIRTLGGILDTSVELLGGVPVAVPSPDMYTAIQRGTVDGALMVYTSAPAYNLQEVCKYATVGSRLGGLGQGLLIGENSWQKLPQDVRDAMTQAGKETADSASKWLDSQVSQNIAKFETQGMKITRLPQAEQARWAKALEPVTGEWLKQMTSKGLNGQQAIDSYKKAAGLR